MTRQGWDFEGMDLGRAVVIDTSLAHSARAYNYWLGGQTHFQVDREMSERIEAAVPTIKFQALANRKFMNRAVRFLVGEMGVSQILDIGSGIPGPGNVHEVAQGINPQARVQYVDNDPIVLAHAAPLLAGTRHGDSSFILADLRDPASILREVLAYRTLDLSEPVALMFCAVLSLFRDDEDPHALMRTILDELPSGSYLVINHPTGDFNPEQMTGALEAMEKSRFTFVPRTRERIAEFFDGLEFVEPGLVPVLLWRPESDEAPEDPHAAYYFAGIARKP